MKILSIDPGIKTGISIFTVKDHAVTLDAAFCQVFDKKVLADMRAFIYKMIRFNHIDCVVSEEFYAGGQHMNGLGMSYYQRGIILEVCETLGVPCSMYSPPTWRAMFNPDKTKLESADARKHHLLEMLNSFYGLSLTPATKSLDDIDSVGIGVYHIVNTGIAGHAPAAAGE